MVSVDDIEALHRLYTDIVNGTVRNLGGYEPLIERVASGCVAAGRQDAADILSRAEDRSILINDVGALASIAQEVLLSTLPPGKPVPPKTSEDGGRL